MKCSDHKANRGTRAVRSVDADAAVAFDRICKVLQGRSCGCLRLKVRKSTGDLQDELGSTAPALSSITGRPLQRDHTRPTLQHAASFVGHDPCQTHLSQLVPRGCQQTTTIAHSQLDSVASSVRLTEGLSPELAAAINRSWMPRRWPS